MKIYTPLPSRHDKVIKKVSKPIDIPSKNYPAYKTKNQCCCCLMRS